MAADRRTFLQTLALSAAYGCARTDRGVVRPVTALDLSRAPEGPGADGELLRLAALPEDHRPFPIGALAGDATETRAMITTRYTGTAPLRLVVRERLDPLPSRTVFDGTVAPDPDGFVRVDLRSLVSGARYHYRFVHRTARGATRGPAGTFRTAPPALSAETVRFAGTSCTDQRVSPFPTLTHAARRGPSLDFFLHAGDHAYVHDIRTLDAIRSDYARTWRSAGMRALHGSVGLYATWDDHEVANNWDPERIDPAALARTRRAFLEHHPLRTDPALPSRTWRSFRWGRAVEVFILDTRSERRPSTRHGANARYISRAQFEWLTEGLRRSEAVFKCIVNSVPIGAFPGLFDIARQDRWEGYPAQREALLSTIARERIEGVLWLSGDFHLGSVSTLESEGPYRAMREVLMGPGGQLSNPLARCLHGPQWEFVTEANNITYITIDPVAATLALEFRDPDDRSRFRRTYRPSPGGVTPIA